MSVVSDAHTWSATHNTSTYNRQDPCDNENRHAPHNAGEIPEECVGLNCCDPSGLKTKNTQGKNGFFLSQKTIHHTITTTPKQSVGVQILKSWSDLMTQRGKVTDGRWGVNGKCWKEQRNPVLTWSGNYNTTLSWSGNSNRTVFKVVYGSTTNTVSAHFIIAKFVIVCQAFGFAWPSLGHEGHVRPKAWQPITFVVLELCSFWRIAAFPPAPLSSPQVCVMYFPKCFMIKAILCILPKISVVAMKNNY